MHQATEGKTKQKKKSIAELPHLLDFDFRRTDSNVVHAAESANKPTTWD